MLYIPNETGSPADSKQLPKLYFWRRVVRWSVVGIVVPPLFGLSSTVFNMVSTFDRVMRNENVDVIEAELSTNISGALLATALGIPFSTIALLLLIVAISRFYSVRKQCFGSQ